MRMCSKGGREMRSVCLMNASMLKEGGRGDADSKIRDRGGRK